MGGEADAAPMTEPSASEGASGEREVEPVASECEWAEFDNELNRALVIFGQNHYPWTKCQQVRSLFQNGSLWATLQDGSRRAVVSHVRRGLEAAMRDKNAQNKPCRWNSRDSHQHLPDAYDLIVIVDKEQGWDREVPREIFDMMVEEVGRRYPTKRPLLNILRDALKRELFYTEWHTIDSGYQLELLQEVRNLYVRIREWEKLNGTRRKRPLQSFLEVEPFLEIFRRWRIEDSSMNTSQIEMPQLKAHAQPPVEVPPAPRHQVKSTPACPIEMPRLKADSPEGQSPPSPKQVVLDEQDQQSQEEGQDEQDGATQVANKRGHDGSHDSPSPKRPRHGDDSQ
ncbi:hypothetical protein JCM3766R1_001303 [Sporobolomyces carnicolor]